MAGVSGELAALLSGELNLDLPLSQPEAVQLRAWLPQVSVTAGPIDLRFPEGIRLDWAQNVTVLHPTLIEGTDISLQASGSLFGFSTLDCQLSGRADLALLSPLIPIGHSLQGPCDVDIRATGPITAPLFNGGGQIRDGTFRIPELKFHAANITSTFRAEGRSVVIDKLQGITEEGTVGCTGTIELSGFIPAQFDLRLRAEDIEIKQVKGLKANADAELALTGQLAALELKGQAVLKNASYRGRLDYRSLIVEQSRAVLSLRTRTMEPDPSPVSGSSLRFDIKLRTRDGLLIQNNVADLSLAGDVTMKGSLEHPQLFGRLEATGGEITYESRKFALDSATLDFTNPLEIDPYIALQARANVDKYVLRLSMEGSLFGTFTINLSSSPPLGDVDLWTLLALGRTTEALSRGGSALTATEAADVLTGEIQDELEKRLTAISGVDEVMINPIFSDTSSSAAARFTVRKQLGDRLSVTYSTDTSSSGNQLMFIEYLLNDQLKLVGEKTEEGSFGADLRLHFELP